MTDKRQDNSGFKAATRPAAPHAAAGDPVDFGTAIAEIEAANPALLNPANKVDNTQAVATTGYLAPATEGAAVVSPRDGVSTLTTADPEVAAAYLEVLEKEIGGPLLGFDLVEDKEGAILLCGMIIHNTVEAMNAAHNETTLSWKDNRDSVVNGVRRVLANPKESSEENHQAWWDYKIKDGWVYGPSKDPVMKTHPCMVPYAALGPFQQSKDLVFHAIVRTFFGL